MKCGKFYLNILIITLILLSLCEARGGRRGGSFGGIFGSWRKYKKPSTGSGSSRRIVSSSPVHTPITKALHENKKNGDKFQKNFKINGYYNNYNTPPLPTGGSYYHNTAAMPGNAIYVAQSPPRGSEFGDFLTGYLTGRLLTMGFSAPHYHQVTHVYRDSPQMAEEKSENSSSKFIIINRQDESSTDKIPAYKELVAEALTTVDSSLNSSELASYSSEPPLTVTENPSPPYGVICMPLMVNETSSTGEIVQIERIICYPAPAPPTPQYELKPKPVEIAGDIEES